MSKGRRRRPSTPPVEVGTLRRPVVLIPAGIGICGTLVGYGLNVNGYHNVAVGNWLITLGVAWGAAAVAVAL